MLVKSESGFITGTLGALNAAVTLSAYNSAGAIGWEIGTGLVGTVVFEATNDDINWFAINAMRVDGTIIGATSAFPDRGVFTSSVYSKVRIRVSVYTSGSSPAAVNGALVGHDPVRLAQAIPTGDNIIGRVKLSDGADVADITAASALKVDGSAVTQPVGGDIAHGAVDSGNPVKAGVKVANAALPTAEANNDRANLIGDRYGRLIVTPSVDQGSVIWKSGEWTSAQTGTNIWTPTTGNRFAITSLQISTGGTTAGLVTVWGAASGTTTFVAGTDQQFFRGELAPSATNTPNVIIQPSHPMYSDTTNDVLKITTSTAITLYLTVYGFEITP